MGVAMECRLRTLHLRQSRSWNFAEESAPQVPMASEEKIRRQHIRKLILANEPDNEYEFEISSSSYDRLKVEFGKDNEDDSYATWSETVTIIRLMIGRAR
ncbi:hypothetical protein V1517DRAFT_324262 [Lipomyces orientalis]|uniref:Uncharacterized protein n=1 Tax=Lipomyces orientalis TaxID=1233043 RepID=A0ACC3TLU0_9ASCO